jgi:guanyl-specific ribonuclease Sa
MSTENWPPPQPHRRRLWAGSSPEPPPPPPPQGGPPPPPPPPQRGGDNFALIAIGLGLLALGAVIAAIASSSGDHSERPRVASNTATSSLTDTTESTAPTTPPPTTPSTPTSTVPTPPLNPRHIVHKAVVGSPIPQRDDGILFRVDSIRQVSSIPHERYRDPIEPSPSKKLIRADITYVNKTHANTDVFCGGYSARLLDSSGHRIEPLDSYIDIKGNDDVCGGNKIAPNETSHVILGFKVPKKRSVRGIFLFNSKAADFDGADTKIFFALR